MTPERIGQEVATLTADPSRVADLERSRVADLLAEVERLRVRLWARLQEPTRKPPEDRPPPSDVERARGDRLLDAKEAAERLGLDRRALYRRADRLPFTRRLGPRTLRFSERGLEAWLADR